MVTDLALKDGLLLQCTGPSLLKTLHISLLSKFGAALAIRGRARQRIVVAVFMLAIGKGVGYFFSSENCRMSPITRELVALFICLSKRRLSRRLET